MKQKLIACLTVVLLVSASALATGEIYVTGIQGRSANQNNPDAVSTSQYLQVRSTAGSARKAWLQFDLRPFYAEDSSIQGRITDAKLTFGCATSSTSNRRYRVNALNDSANLENWDASTLTWNNAPGNDITSPASLDTTKTVFFYQTQFTPDPQTGTTLDTQTETPELYRPALTAFLNTDTDGLVTIILCGGDTTDLYNVGTPLEPILTITYPLGYCLEKAHYPVPAHDVRVKSNLASLSWTNPQPKQEGGSVYCDVYFGTEPNILIMDKVTLDPFVSTVEINTTNFPTYGTLLEPQEYYWRVDVHDSSDPNVITGQMWHFYVNNNEAPVVNAGADQVVWLDSNNTATVNLDAAVSDDGRPAGSSLTYQWIRVSGPTSAVINSPATEDTSITFTARGTYVFQLTVSDGDLSSSDTVQIFVGTNPCDASHLSTNAPYNLADVNRDCLVDLQDFYYAIAEDWLVCTDVLDNCGR